MNLILKVTDFSILCNFVVKETGFLPFFFLDKQKMSCSVMGVIPYLLFLGLHFCGKEIFPNTGHKQSRGQRSTEASSALGWDWAMESQPSRWGGTLLRLKPLHLRQFPKGPSGVVHTEERTPVPKHLLGDCGEMAAFGDEEGRGHRWVEHFNQYGFIPGAVVRWRLQVWDELFLPQGTKTQ